MKSRALSRPLSRALSRPLSDTGSTYSIPAAFQGSFLTGSVSDERLNEVSDIACSFESTLYFWALEDSGASAVIHPVRWNGITEAEVSISGASNTDWESMGSASIGGTNYIYIGDTGNNAQGARTYRLYRVVEPSEADVLAGTADTTGDVETITITPGS